MNWECPYCGNHTTLIEKQTIQRMKYSFNVPGKHLDDENRTHYNFCLQAISCPNASCEELSLSSSLSVGAKRYSQYSGNVFEEHEKLKTWFLLPQASFKHFPDYIPGPIRKDYEESCKIKRLSPKASATLARRCLQGMIRDFWGIKKGRLYDEISELSEKVDSDIWEAIDSVRRIGNIGAHMKKDINMIVDIEENEVDSLIWLIELLIKEWYISREERAKRLAALKVLAEEKSDN